MFTFRFASCLAVLAAFAVTLPTASAQAPMQGTHVLRTWEDPVKLANGTEAVYRYELSYDYATGETLRRAYDGAVLVETVEMKPPGAPFPVEIEAAMSIIRADEALSALASRSNAHVGGGFILFGEQYAACAPPARCLQFDIMSQDRTESLQFVVVDLHSGTIIERDFYPDL